LEFWRLEFRHQHHGAAASPYNERHSGRLARDSSMCSLHQSPPAVITQHVYAARRIVVVRGAGRVSSEDWAKGIEELRHDAEFDAEFNGVFVAMDRDAINAANAPRVVDLMMTNFPSAERLAVVAIGDSKAAVAAALAQNRRARTRLVRSFVSESAALAWAGWAPATEPTDRGYHAQIGKPTDGSRF
jgi:hypothetical protein